MPRPLVATIHLRALQHNLAVARRHAPSSRTWAVVKANAYGHGLLRAARCFAESDGLALIEPEGAVVLREAGWTKPILLLEGCFDADDWHTAQQYDLAVAVHTVEQIDCLEASGVSGPIPIWLKINSGMNRLGFQPSAFRDAFKRLKNISAVGEIGFLTHFANADVPLQPALSMSAQQRCFDETVAGLHGSYSLANSAADLLHPEVAADWIRPGVMLYGGAPGAQPAASFGLQPGMTLSSRLIGIQHIDTGDAVGYGSAFVADGPMTIGIVACGYADGYPRHAPTGTPILVEGFRTRTLGRVSMDMLIADLSNVPDAKVGSAVTLWGRGLPIDDVAQAAGTIGYELMCALTQRVRIVEDMT